jgi:hypothetical protein
MDRGRDRLARRAVAVADHHARPLAGEEDSGRAADAVRAAGDDRDFSREPH